MSLDRVIESETPTFLLPFNEEDQVQTKCSPCKQLGSSTRSSKDRTFIIRYPTAVKIPISPSERKWVRVPTIRWSRNDIIMALYEEFRGTKIMSGDFIYP
jgi:hypothetical protein